MFWTNLLIAQCKLNDIGLLLNLPDIVIDIQFQLLRIRRHQHRHLLPQGRIRAGQRKTRHDDRHHQDTERKDDGHRQLDLMQHFVHA